MAEDMNSKKGEGEPEKNLDDPALPQRPKHIFRKNQKIDPLRSKSANLEVELSRIVSF